MSATTLILALADPLAWFQVAAWIAAAGGLIVAILKFAAELREGRRQRERDLRWRQAEAGKSLNDEMQDDERAWSAMQMLDYGDRTFNIPNVGMRNISEQEIRAALDPEKPEINLKDVFIRDCFDCLFYFMAMIDHYTTSKLILGEDVAYPLEYYVLRMENYKTQIVAYLSKYKLTRTAAFLLKYDGWDALKPLIRDQPPLAKTNRPPFRGSLF